MIEDEPRPDAPEAEIDDSDVGESESEEFTVHHSTNSINIAVPGFTCSVTSNTASLGEIASWVSWCRQLVAPSINKKIPGGVG